MTRRPVITHGDEELELDYLPPWRARDEIDEQAMIRWCHQKLVGLEIERWKEIDATGKHLKIDGDNWELVDKDGTVIEAGSAPLGVQIYRAEQGDIEPLRRKLPHLAKFLNLPKKEHGKGKHPRRKNSNRVDAAARDVDRIRALWHQYYPDDYPDGAHRMADDGPSAFEIVTLRYGRGTTEARDAVTIEDVKEAHKRLSEPSRRRRSS